MKHTAVFVQAVRSQLKGISRPQGKRVMTVFVEVLPLPKASEARTFSESKYVQEMIGVGVGYEIFP